MTANPMLDQLELLVGTWTTEATHPDVPGVVVHGTAFVEWLEGRRFLLQRTRTDHPDFPDALWVIGEMEHDRVEGADRGAPLRIHYFDSRGVFRIYETTIDGASWQYSRNAPGFSQRFTGTFADSGDTIVGQSQLCRDDVHWADDLAITYRRAKG